jgi:uncharacterized protein (DUF1778 family)
MTKKRNRREIRLTVSDDGLITEAAGLVEATVTKFIVDRAVTDAKAIVDAHHSIRLEADAYGRFLSALDGPPAPVAELVAQIRKIRPLEAR